jgi:hypothetical protein
VTITLSSLDFLASEAGTRLLDHLAQENLSDSNTLSLLTKLRRDYPPEQAGAALEMARLRLKAVDKFGVDAARMFFTAGALEQASDPLIRSYRAVEAKDMQVADACCGIGSDSLSFARSAKSVFGIDLDPVRVAIAQYNAKVLGVANTRFEVADVREGMPPADLIFFDPARRDTQGKRIYDVQRYQPPLSVIQDWKAGQIYVKLSPGVDLSQLEPYNGRVEFISVAGDLKEALLKLPREGNASLCQQATLLTEAGVYRWQHEQTEVRVELSEPRGWLVEPDPSLLRAGLVQDVAAAFGGFLLDETIAYFTTATAPDSVWVRAWQILDWMPFNLKHLRAYLRERGIGQVTVKKRGSPITPEELIPKLKLKGNNSRTLILTRCKGAPIVIIGV